ncbi:MAG: FKBP-type peptidyl-prolyl cis-trans isomerase [Bacteroidia bacterium]|jgi:FKBP-type peptidyl-prolyl cis-trans isomerase|nr:FKBP-type peptidyl-prolyl cis-trans isomerase [Bacteroidia bacterium]
MRIYILPLLCLATVLFHACGSESSKFPGYSEAGNEVYWKLIEPGEADRKPGENDYIEVRMRNSLNGTVFFDSELQSVRGTVLMPFAGNKHFAMLHEGDSASILLPGGDLRLPGMPDTGMMQMNIRLVRILNEEEYNKRMAQTDTDADEQILIARYLNREKITARTDSLGMVFVPVTEGSGRSATGAKTVTVRYTGSFLNGRVFDNNASGEQGVAFAWGSEGQLIPGLTLALRRMKTGGKAKIVLPSALAFGNGGSSTGLIPPHTPVVYELEFLSAE